MVKNAFKEIAGISIIAVGSWMVAVNINKMIGENFPTFNPIIIGVVLIVIGWLMRNKLQ